MDAVGERSLVGQVAALEDARQPGKVRYPLPEVMPLLLARLQPTGALVTIDARGRQAGIAQARITQTILDRGAHYLLALQDNQRGLAEEVTRLFSAPDGRADGRTEPPFETTDHDHGRLESRRHGVSHEADWLTTERRCPGLKAIAMVEATVQRNGTTTPARGCFRSSVALEGRLLARAVRAHWGSENPPHRVLDVVFHDDLMRRRTQHRPNNMATIKPMARNLMRKAAAKDSRKVRRKAAGWSQDYLKPIITQTAQ